MKKLTTVIEFMHKLQRPYKSVRTWWWRRRVNRSIRILDELDWHFIAIGWSRQQRRRFWRDFAKKQENRTAVLNKITQE